MPELDPLIMARLQFAVTVSFHILFPSLTIGLAGYLAFMEWRWLATKNDVYLKLYKFWVKIFALTFGMGVVSGIVLSYQFGTNWAEFSRIGGPVLGPVIAYEVLTAFFLEAGFLGVMLFGWDKVGNRLHFLATCLVAFGTALSAFWILAANSWMQTPAGAEIVDGIFIPQDWLEIIFNPSAPFRIVHMITASFLTAALVIAGISAIYLLQKRHEEVAKAGFSMAVWALMVLAPAQIVIGDFHGINTLEHQPIKLAAIEGNWETQSCAPMVIFGIPDEDEQRNLLEVSVPCVASLYLTHSWDGVVPGLKEAPLSEQPPVGVVFWSFRVMVGLGLIFLAAAVWGVFARMRGTLFEARNLQRLHALLIPAGFIAILGGWFTTEVGRQPYIIYGHLTVADAISPVVSGNAILVTLALFLLVYGAIFGAYLYYMVRMVQKGPEELEAIQPKPEAIQGARPGLVVPAE